ncbi:Deoxyuridine 5'-triphosphate nucleotidohydrolase [Golovinomyces cichoracearum]|uniref:dUTP diphosphatase n=1 Tax=Golovinomyces cichoracearum TaxID=62708 RepID=A0A420HLY3_9PEZI|nr:Deoxyuridine 5'-triphosphate nucleotidohydrolase [Golovinomyces cichoracearum]
MNTTSLLVKKLSSRARLPTRGSAFAAGYDLHAAEEINIPARGKALVPTNIAIALPPGTSSFFYLTMKHHSPSTT